MTYEFNGGQKSKKKKENVPRVNYLQVFTIFYKSLTKS